MSWKDVFLSLQGRISRSTYWLGGLAILVYELVLLGIFIALVADSTQPIPVRIVEVALPVGLLSLPAVYAGLAIAVKRLHDRDKSGWWVLLFYWVPGILDQAARHLGEGALGWIFSTASFAISIWALVELGFLRGTRGPNRFGSDPLESSPTARMPGGNLAA